jgi:dolichol-phosphate mannosyltransferase
VAQKFVTSEKIFTILPTYNEGENISRLIPIILKKGSKIKILVVDDNSPDGTGNIVAEMAEGNDRIFLLSRPGKMGLGTAYVAGFKWVLANSDAKYIFEMDADFSHNPDRIPDFIRKMKEGYDVVVGSRYLRGVSVVNWPIRRLMLSYLASRYARFVTGIPLNDQTSGYKCFRREVLEKLDLNQVVSDGYAFQIEMNYLAFKQGFQLTETPIIFEERRAGASKISREIVREAMWVVWRLRLNGLLSRGRVASSKKVSDHKYGSVRN